MRPLKAQSDIVGAIMIVLIAIALVGTALAFGLPLIQKNQDRALEERVNAVFNPENSNSLPAKIESVANSGGKDQIDLDVEGATRLYKWDSPGPVKNAIEFSFKSRVSRYAIDAGWIPLSPEKCPDPEVGTIGTDEPSVVCVRADSSGSGFYNITYRLYLRELEDTLQRNGFKINLVEHSSTSVLASGGTVSIRVEFDSREPTFVGNKNLITTSVKILLV